MRPAQKRSVAVYIPIGARRLNVEQLEDRRMLAGSQAMHNPVFPMDVNNDVLVTPLDLAQLQDRLQISGAFEVPPLDPNNRPTSFYDVTGDGIVSARDALTLLDRFNLPVTVTMATAVPPTVADPIPQSVDVTPQLRIAASSPAKLPDGRVVQVDVDLNNDGKFQGAELNYAHATLYNGGATFDLTPALPLSLDGAPYTVGLQAHVQDSDGVVGYSAMQKMKINTAPSNILKDYVAAPDASYHFEIKQTTNFSGKIGSVTIPVLYTVYDVRMQSQVWRTTADVDKPDWLHWMRIIVPSPVTGPLNSTGLFLIDGGSFSETLPENDPGDDPRFDEIGKAAVAMHSVVIDLQDVPNEPLTFTGDPGNPRSEDAIIAYSFNQYISNIGAAGNDTWPALLPMVKSAVRGMDTVQTLAPQLTGAPINDFIVTGYSKRGWTTWLTAAVDPRVRAIVPGVFDNLDQAAQMVHQYQVYGFFSQAVQDYNDFDIFQRITTPVGQQLSSIVDPYYYLNDPRMTMPKLLINSAGDEFFVSDSAQFYFHDLPGTQNYLRYLPNDGHGLDETNPITSTITFTDAVVNNKPLPQFSWTVQPDGSIRVKTVDAPSQVLIWSATNPNARDFRHLFTTPPIMTPPVVWTSQVLAGDGSGVYVGSEPTPDTGATAFFVELTFPSTIAGNPFIFTTEIHVNSKMALTDWPPPLQTDPVPTAVASGLAALSSEAKSSDTLTSALAAWVARRPAVDATVVAAPLFVPTSDARVSLQATSSTGSDSASSTATKTATAKQAGSCQAESDTAAVDEAFDSFPNELLA